jgi:hypothetical protein
LSCSQHKAAAVLVSEGIFHAVAPEAQLLSVLRLMVLQSEPQGSPQHLRPGDAPLGTIGIDPVTLPILQTHDHYQGQDDDGI